MTLDEIEQNASRVLKIVKILRQSESKRINITLSCTGLFYTDLDKLKRVNFQKSVTKRLQIHLDTLLKF